MLCLLKVCVRMKGRVQRSESKVKTKFVQVSMGAIIRWVIMSDSDAKRRVHMRARI